MFLLLIPSNSPSSLPTCQPESMEMDELMGIHLLINVKKLACVLPLPFVLFTLGRAPLLCSFWLFQAGSMLWVTMAAGIQREAGRSLLSAYADVISILLTEWLFIVQPYMAQTAKCFRIPWPSFWFLGLAHLCNGQSGEQFGLHLG